MKNANFDKRIYVGTHGNLSAEPLKQTFSSVVASTVIDVVEVPVGIKFIGFRVNTQGLGAGVKLTAEVDGKTLFTDLDVATVTNAVLSFAPVYTEAKGALKVTVTGGTADGMAYLTPEYLAIGY